MAEDCVTGSLYFWIEFGAAVDPLTQRQAFAGAEVAVLLAENALQVSGAFQNLSERSLIVDQHACRHLKKYVFLADRLDAKAFRLGWVFEAGFFASA
ncbi:hypothetical protein D3C86_1796480 [compost metagenome]